MNKDILIGLLIVISTFAVPMYFFGINGIWIGLLIALVICCAGGSEDCYD